MLDCSKTQRDEEFKLRQAAKQLKSDNPGTNFRTRDMSIQVQTAQVKWKQMKRYSTGNWLFSQQTVNQSTNSNP